MVNFTKSEIKVLDKIFMNPTKFNILKQACAIKGGSKEPAIQRNADINKELYSQQDRNPVQFNLQPNVAIPAQPQRETQRYSEAREPRIERNAQPNLYDAQSMQPMQFNMPTYPDNASRKKSRKTLN